MKRVCYYAIPIPDSADGTVRSKLLPEDIDPFLCTHLIVAFAQIKDDVIKPFRESDIDVSICLYLCLF